MSDIYVSINTTLQSGIYSYFRMNNYNTPRKPNRRYSGPPQKKRRYSQPKMYRTVAQRSAISEKKYGEIKSIDIVSQDDPTLSDIDYFLFVSQGKVTPLNLIQQGAAGNERIGRKVSLKSVQIRGFFLANPAEGITVSPELNYMRMLVVYDKQTNGTLPNINAILQNQFYDGSYSLTETAGLNINSRDRFEILLDKMFVLPSDTAGFIPSATVDLLHVEEYRKLKGKETCYNTSTGSIGDIATGGLFLVCIGNIDGTVVEEAPSWVMNAAIRLRYYE